MTTDRYEELWESDWRTVAKVATEGNYESPTWVLAHAVLDGRVAQAQYEAARSARRMATATIVLAAATVVLAVATIVLVFVTG
jgi:hypothetical protein